MVKKIMREPLFLAQKSEDATEDDKQVARGVDEVKQEAAHKEAPKVRDDKAR